MTSQRRSMPWPALALAIGVANGLIFLGFEWVVHHGTDWIWHNLAGTDEQRWRVIPLAIVLSLALSAVLRLSGVPRWTTPHLDPLADADSDEPPPTLQALATLLVIGAVSLLAGASLGPEASLIAVAIGLGTLLTAHTGADTPQKVAVLASVGALLVAFFGSPIAILIPLLALFQKGGRPTASSMAFVVVAGLTAWGVLWLVQGNGDGYGAIASAEINARDYVAALLLGAIAAGLGALLTWFIDRLGSLTEAIDARAPWWLAATIFGGVLGVLYLIGGPTVQFSGNEGSALLLSGEYRYGAWALAGLAILKLIVTGWSLTSGYRGGLIFPAVFAGVAASACVATAVPSLAGPGVLLGSIAGLLVAMTSPALGVVMLLALLPLKLLPLGLAGAAGAFGGRTLLHRRSSVE